MLADRLILSVFPFTALLSRHALSSFVVSCVVSSLLYMSPLFSCSLVLFSFFKQRDGNTKDEGRQSDSAGLLWLLLKSEFPQVFVAVFGASCREAVVEADRKLVLKLLRGQRM